jgi:hypothetical protein
MFVLQLTSLPLGTALLDKPNERRTPSYDAHMKHIGITLSAPTGESSEVTYTTLASSSASRSPYLVPVRGSSAPSCFILRGAGMCFRWGLGGSPAPTARLRRGNCEPLSTEFRGGLLLRQSPTAIGLSPRSLCNSSQCSSFGYDRHRPTLAPLGTALPVDTPAQRFGTGTPHAYGVASGQCCRVRPLSVRRRRQPAPS